MTFTTIIFVAIEFLMILMVGIYFIFSNTIMSSLKKIENGAETMVEINKQILNPLFYLCFFGSAMGSLVLSIYGTPFQLAAGLIFFLGTFLVTLLCNVPQNNALLDSFSADEKTSNVSETWSDYLKTWVFWNNIRTLSSMISGILLLL